MRSRKSGQLASARKQTCIANAKENAMKEKLAKATKELKQLKEEKEELAEAFILLWLSHDSSLLNTETINKFNMLFKDIMIKDT